MKTKLLLLLGLALNLFAAEGPVPVPNFPLVNAAGKPFQLYDLKGNYTFVSFVYSRCPMPTMCPLTMKLSKELFVKAQKEVKDVPLHFLFVTLDPKNDTPAVLRAYAKKHSLADKKNVTFATGSEQVLSDLAAEFNVIGLPADGTISHNLKSILLTPELVDLKQYKENEWKPEQVIADLTQNAKATK